MNRIVRMIVTSLFFVLAISLACLFFVLTKSPSSTQYSKVSSEAQVQTESRNQAESTSSSVSGSTVSSSIASTASSSNEEEKTETSTSQAGGPIKKRLDIVPQVQQLWYHCAPTTVSMMLSSQGIQKSQQELADEMGTYEPFGTHNRDAIRILNKHMFGYEYPADGQAGYRLETVTDANPDGPQMKLFKERLKANIDSGYPMYYTFEVSVMTPGKSGEHNVIGTGYLTNEDGTDIDCIYYIDPSPLAQNPTYAGLKIVTPEQIFQAMVPCQEPNYAW